MFRQFIVNRIADVIVASHHTKEFALAAPDHARALLKDAVSQSSDRIPPKPASPAEPSIGL